MPQMNSRPSQALWLQVRADYEQGHGSCRELALCHGLHPEAVSSRCKREHWRKGLAEAGRKLAEKIDQNLTERAGTFADRAFSFRERVADESERWLDSIHTAGRSVSPGDVDGLCKLISAWRVPAEVGAKAYQLDKGGDIRPTGHLIEVSSQVIDQEEGTAPLLPGVPAQGQAEG